MTGPVTQVTLSGTLGTNGWYRSTAKVSLVATDNLNGVSATYYTIDGGSTKTYSQTFNLSSNGTVSVSGHVTDTVSSFQRVLRSSMSTA
jgi:hypothetical protein